MGGSFVWNSTRKHHVEGMNSHPFDIGDTDTNGVITGALFRAKFGHEAFTQDQLDRVNSCRPGVSEPRSERYWVKDVRGLPPKLLAV